MMRFMEAAGPWAGAADALRADDVRRATMPFPRFLDPVDPVQAEKGNGTRVYAFIEVTYRNGQAEKFSPDYRFISDRGNAAVLWVCDANGPLYMRFLHEILSIQMREVAA